MPAKVDEIRKAIQKKNPEMSDSSAWAIAYSTYNKIKGKQAWSERMKNLKEDEKAGKIEIDGVKTPVILSGSGKKATDEKGNEYVKKDGWWILSKDAEGYSGMPPVGPGPMRAKVIGFLRAHPIPTDKQIISFAQANAYVVEDVKKELYKMASEHAATTSVVTDDLSMRIKKLHDDIDVKGAEQAFPYKRTIMHSEEQVFPAVPPGPQSLQKEQKLMVSDELVKQIAVQIGYQGPLDQLKKGMKVEQEHSDLVDSDPVMIAKIAVAHIKELPDYYDRLDRMEKGKESVKEEDYLKQDYDKAKAYLYWKGLIEPDDLMTMSKEDVIKAAQTHGWKGEKLEEQDEPTKQVSPLRNEVVQWLKENPNPNDEQVHKFAVDHGFKIEEVEQVLYELATEHLPMLEDNPLQEESWRERIHKLTEKTLKEVLSEADDLVPGQKVIWKSPQYPQVQYVAQILDTREDQAQIKLGAGYGTKAGAQFWTDKENIVKDDAAMNEPIGHRWENYVEDMTMSTAGGVVAPAYLRGSGKKPVRERIESLHQESNSQAPGAGWETSQALFYKYPGKEWEIIPETKNMSTEDLIKQKKEREDFDEKAGKKVEYSIMKLNRESLSENVVWRGRGRPRKPRTYKVSTKVERLYARMQEAKYLKENESLQVKKEKIELKINSLESHLDKYAFKERLSKKEEKKMNSIQIKLNKLYKEMIILSESFIVCQTNFHALELSRMLKSEEIDSTVKNDKVYFPKSQEAKVIQILQKMQGVTPIVQQESIPSQFWEFMQNTLKQSFPDKDEKTINNATGFIWYKWMPKKGLSKEGLNKETVLEAAKEMGLSQWKNHLEALHKKMIKKEEEQVSPADIVPNINDPMSPGLPKIRIPGVPIPASVQKKKR